MKPSLHQQMLLKLRQEFQRFTLIKGPPVTHHWSLIPEEIDTLLAHALLSLCESLKLDRAAIFLLDDRTHLLLARQLVDNGNVMAGEEEIAVLPHSPMSAMLFGKRAHLTVGKPAYTVYIPLRAYGQTFGVLRVENALNKQVIHTSLLPFLHDVADEIARLLRGVEMSITEREQVAHMQALREISTAIFRSLRLEEMLMSVAQSLINQIGFDRTKIYLINKEGDALESVLTVDQRHRQSGADKESYPLKAGVHPMVDLILGKTDERIEKYERTIIYLPLRTRDENMGVLMVDNILSQQEIPREQLPILTAIAGQLGMGIKNARLFQGVEELSITDGLTGLYLLRYFKQRLKEEFYRAERTQGNLSLMIMDVDHFKRFNDTYGHPMGDTILASVAERILSNARKIDLTARYGGDEFVILLPDTSADEALLLAERLHHAVSSEPVTLAGKATVHITVSIGIATYPVHASSVDELIQRADEALYWIKSHGRNRFRLYSTDIQPKIKPLL